MSKSGPGMLREGGEGDAEVKPVELFFDLVYVLAVTQITHYLVNHLTWRGAGQALLLLSAVWERWISTTWITNYLDMGTRPVRLILIGVTFASLMMSAALPEAFEARGLSFAIVLVAIRIGEPAFVLADLGRDHHLSLVLARQLVWRCWSACCGSPEDWRRTGCGLRSGS